MKCYLPILLLCLGCQYESFSSEGFETVSSAPELEEVVREGVIRWRAATGRSWVYSHDRGDYHVEFGVPPGNGLGYHYIDGNIVVDETLVDSPHFMELILHELGHAFSYGHHEEIGVMAVGLGGERSSSCLTEADVVWACSFYDCTKFQPEC